MSVGKELLNVPFPEMVVKLATAIAEGQMKLDMVSCEIAKYMGSVKKAKVTLPDLLSDDDENDGYETSLIGAGFQPTFYQFTDTIIEVKMAITMSTSHDSTISTSASYKGLAGFGVAAATMNASYTSKYSYEASGSSLLRTRITPVPPSTFMQKMLEMKAQKIQMKFQLEMKELELELAAKQAAAEAEAQKKAATTTS